MDHAVICSKDKGQKHDPARERLRPEMEGVRRAIHPSRINTCMCHCFYFQGDPIPPRAAESLTMDEIRHGFVRSFVNNRAYVISLLYTPRPF